MDLAPHLASSAPLSQSDFVKMTDKVESSDQSLTPTVIKAELDTTLLQFTLQWWKTGLPTLSVQAQTINAENGYCGYPKR